MDPFGEMQCNFNPGGSHHQPPLETGMAASSTNTMMTPSGKPAQGPGSAGISPTTPNDPEQQQEKADCSPENSKKSDSSPEGDEGDAFGRAEAMEPASETGGRSVSNSVSLQEMLKTGRSVSEEPSSKGGNAEDAQMLDSVRNAFAFTIDFGDGRKAVDSQRHEKMLERFQARHKRGVSLSKLESSSSSSAPSSARQQQGGGARAPASVNLPRRNKAGYDPVDQPQQNNMVMVDDATGRPVAVKLREKNQRTAARGETATKRHSWSPRTSMTEMGAGGRPQESTPKSSNKPSSAVSGRYAPKSVTLAMALEQQQQQVESHHAGKDASYSSSEFNAESLDSSGGIPCLEAPLENFRPSKGTGEGDEDDISEAGTYTIDGANYTEEQKERMNIDRFGPPFAAVPPEIDPVSAASAPSSKAAAPVRPTGFREELEVIDLERTMSGGGGRKITPSSGKLKQNQPHQDPASEKRSHNILEVSYFHEPAGVPMASDKGVTERAKSKQSYIEKLKSRMKHMAQKTTGGGGAGAGTNRSSADKLGIQQQPQHQVVMAPELDSPDQGTFTSVTTSGILSLKPTLPTEANPVTVATVATQRRRGSLTKAHIDSSEYVQGVAKLNIHSGVSSSVVLEPNRDDLAAKGSLTEQDAADAAADEEEEELKILNCYTDSEKAHKGTGHQRQTKGRTKDASPVGSGRRKHHQPTSSDVAALTSVATKKDWIQEWAKNAREYSKSTSPKVHPHDPPPASTAYGTTTAQGSSGPMTRSYGDYDGERNPRNRNQFGYDFDIDLTKSDYYEAKKYEEFGDNLDHRQQQQQQQQQQQLRRGATGARTQSQQTTRHPEYPAGGSDPLVFRQQQHHQQQGQHHPISPEDEAFALPYGMNEFVRTGSRGSTRRYGNSQQQPQHPLPLSAAAKPPMSPSKIPSPIGSIGRARSVSRNRSLQGSNSDLSGNETEMYLLKTAAAISTLQNLQRRNSLRNSSSHHSSSPLSPASRKLSPKLSPMNSLHSPIHSPSAAYQEKGYNNYGDVGNSPLYSPQHHPRGNLQHHQLHQNIGGGVGGHKRNHSLDSGAPDPLSSPGAAGYMSNGAVGVGGHMLKGANANTSPKLDFPKRHHTRHNSFEGVMASLPPKPVKCFQSFDPSGAGYYGGGNELMVGDDVNVDVLGDCQDYDEDFEDDIDDEDEEDGELDQQELHRRAAGLADITAVNDHALPRPRAMSVGPRRTPSGQQQQQQQQHQHQHHMQSSSTGAKQQGTGAAVQQRDAVAMKNVTNRVQKTHSAGGHTGHNQQQQQQQHLTSPIKRSSSFSVKPNVMKPATPTLSTKATGAGVNGRTAAGGGPKIQKSASSTSFKKMVGALDNGVQPQQYHHHAVQPPHHRHQLVMDPNYPDELMLYINDGDDDGLQMHGGADRRHHQHQQGYSSSSLTDEDEDGGELDDEQLDEGEGGRMGKEPLTNTRYNKTFLMRMEQNKKIAAGSAAALAGGAKQSGGAAACPNTPELPRRAVQVRSVGLGRDRASMPRDSSLNRMKQDMALRKSATGREMLLGKGQQQSTQSIQSASSATGGGKVQPKYLDISKYKSSNAANFLKKDESKSYLIRQEGVRKSPSSASVSSALSRTDPSRMSARSIKSASSAASKSSGGGGGGAAGANKKDPVKVAKEQELEMWRRRASYDPMKAALEGKKKQLEESRRMAVQQQQLQQQPHPSDRQSKSNESSVLRSQSYHSGVGNVGGGGQNRLYQGTVGNSSNVNLRGTYNQTLADELPSDDGDSNNRWTLTSTESSEDLEGDLHYIN
uniref:Uncharacterized protein n=1 Tax=Anopheles atroparvus TaxID=41427 RepID=A0A182JN96_ANOAO